MGLRQKPIQEYRPTEESKAAPTANAGENAGLEDVLQVAEAENVIQEKLGLLQGDPGNGTLAHLIERGDQGTGFCQG